MSAWNLLKKATQSWINLNKNLLVEPKIKALQNPPRKKISEKHLRSIHLSQLSISQSSTSLQTKKLKLLWISYWKTWNVLLLWMSPQNVVTLLSIINSLLSWNKSLEVMDLKSLHSPAINLEAKSLKILKLYANGHLIPTKLNSQFSKKSKLMEETLTQSSTILNYLLSKIPFHGILTNFWSQAMESSLSMPLLSKQNQLILQKKFKDFSNDNIYSLNN